MNRGFIIASVGLAALAAAALVLRHRREQSGGRALAKQRGWELCARPQRDLLVRLGEVALMQIGHSRRIVEAFLAPRRTYLFPYVFETGFEHRRRSHRWLVVAQEVEHGCGRAAITQQEWLIVAASGPASHELPLRAMQNHGRFKTNHIAIVEDVEQWRDRLRAGLAHWFAQQPAERTWEILPGFVVGYQPGRLQGEALVELAAAAGELVLRLRS